MGQGTNNKKNIYIIIELEQLCDTGPSSKSHAFFWRSILHLKIICMFGCLHIAIKPIKEKFQMFSKIM
jgi:hypothetical protein